MDPKDLVKDLDSGVSRRKGITGLISRDYSAERQLEMIRAIRSAPQRHAESVQDAILAHIKVLQGGLGPEEELQVCCYLGPEVIRVHQVGIPNWHVLILAGEDANGDATSFIMDMHTVRLSCKVVKVEPPNKPVRIGFVLPEKKDQV